MEAVALLSGGVDSTVALAYAESWFGVEVALALSFHYGQTHNRELYSAQQVARHYGVEHHILDIRLALDTPSALTGHGEIPDTHAEEPDATVVPGRNLVMLAIATAWANAWGYGAVILGANADDRGGYPDCRPDFILPLEEATRKAYGVTIWTPLLRMDKTDIVNLGRNLGAPLELTWSCYRGGHEPCHRCGACISREEAGL